MNGEKRPQTAQSPPTSAISVYDVAEPLPSGIMNRCFVAVRWLPDRRTEVALRCGKASMKPDGRGGLGGAGSSSPILGCLELGATISVLVSFGAATGRLGAAVMPKARSTSLREGLDTNKSDGMFRPVFSRMVPRMERLMRESMPRLARSGAAMISSTSTPISVAMVSRMMSRSSSLPELVDSPLAPSLPSLTEPASLSSGGVVTLESESISGESSSSEESSESREMARLSLRPGVSNWARYALRAPIVG